MEEIRRHAAEHETVEGVETMTAHHQEAVPFGSALQDQRCNGPLVLEHCALEL